MDLFQLKYAVTIAEYCNFSRAAQALFITQPTLSQQIQKLEQELGFQIFFRDSKRVVTSLIGERFLKDANKVIKEFESMQKNMQSIKNMLGSEVIFGTSPIRGSLLSSGILRFLTEFPQVSFRLAEAFDFDLIEMVRNHDVNAAIVSLPSNSGHIEGVRLIPIQEEHLCALLKKDHPLARQEVVDLEDLVYEKLIFASPRSSLRKVIIEAFEKRGKMPGVIIDLSSISARNSLIMNGMVSFALSGRSEWKKQKDVVLVPVVPYIYNTLSVVLPIDEQSSFLVNALVKIMSEEISKQFETTP